MQIGIIGIGNIGKSLIKGLGTKKNNISLIAFDKNEKKNNDITKNTSSKSFKNEKQVIDHSDIIFLCIRTNQVLDWIKNNSRHLFKKTLVLVQSGISLSDIEKKGLLDTIDLIRLITNVNTSVGLGHTIILKNECKNFNVIKSVFSSVGCVICVENERQLNEYSFITGCSPALGAMLLEGVNNGSNIDNIALIAEVFSNTMKTIIATNRTPKEYAKSTYSEGGMFEKCVENIDDNSEFQNILKNWLNPLKKSLE